ncbi:hypothetical protein QBC41DRAFT_397222 [Cercophora samala]|uniref:Uncharacterized protein n=1 Tax=Cercophora samala TaxID=330535 RepID=A0AA39Z9N7_9PEZI|nr:hypothetical protein QBC41DRAFT_397222 [Cercophora samala]
MDSTLQSEYGHDDLFSNYGDDVFDSIYPDLESLNTTPPPTLSLPQAPQQPPTPVQQDTFTFGSNIPTNSYNTAQQMWGSNNNNNNMVPFYDAFGAEYPISGYTQNFTAPQALQAPQAQPVASSSQNKPRTLSDKVRQGKKIIFRRGRGYQNEDPSNIYEKPPAVQAWGPLLKNTKVPEHTFEYCKSFVELAPPSRFTQDELIMFMKGSGCANPQRKLTLWIQNSPSQVNSRYAMGSSSSKCRYRHCPGKFTIWKGFLRIAFDEFSDKTGISLDPFHNAGYMHLHCFEKMFDLAYLIHYGAIQHGFVIKPDERTFPMESRNPMSLVRDHHEMIGAYHEWLRQNQARCEMLFMGQNGLYDGFHIPSPPTHQRTLGYKLTMCHLSCEVSHREINRETRGGANIGVHKGNLEHFMHIKAQMKNMRNNGNFNTRRSRDADEEEMEEEEEVQDTIEYNPRPTKRSRRGRKVPSINTSVDTPPVNLPVDNLVVDNNLITNPLIMDDFNYLPDFNMMGMEFMDFQNDFASFPLTNEQQIMVPPPISPVLQSAGPRTRLRSREMSISLVGFLNNHPNLTPTQAQVIGARLADEPSHIQDSVLSAVQPETANILLRDGISPQVESKIKKLNKRQLKDLETVIERVEKNGDMKRAASMW